MFIHGSILSMLNKTLANNESIVELLKPYANKSFKINFSGICLTAIINQDGFISSYCEPEVSVIIDIPISTSTYLINQSKIDAFKNLKFTGDQQFGRELLEILAKLDIKGGLKTNSTTINIIVDKLLKLIKLCIEQIKLTTNNAAESISQYLLYETEDIVERNELDKFCSSVDEIKGRSELLNQRFNSLLAAKSS